ncbi:MAG: insulinase family protein [Clostridia bacterium]|nr:insulinase family protein [Clostridia bacterium]
MNSNSTIKIAEGVEGLFIKNTRFNTTLISLNFYMPLKSETVSGNAMLTYILSTCSGRFGGFKEMNRHLNMLYGADVAVSAMPVGSTQLIRFVITAINDKYTLGGEQNVSAAADYLLSLLFEPRLQNGVFYEADLLRERRKMLEDLEAELNEKRNFARKRLKEEMFENDPFGLNKLGTKEAILNITADGLKKTLADMLNHAFVSVHAVGETLPEGLFEKIGERFSALKRGNITNCKILSAPKMRDTVKEVTDRMDVVQGKLVMGFTSSVYGDDSVSLPLMVAVDIFGGGPYSRLFSVVREKMSLCYYCSASSVRSRGFVMVDSGLEADNAEKAKNEILNQLQIVKNGEFSDFEFNSSIKSICGSLKSYNDSLSSIDLWYALKIYNQNLTTPEEMCEAVRKITREDVIVAAKSISLNTVYMLLPEAK